MPTVNTFFINGDGGSDSNGGTNIDSDAFETIWGAIRQAAFEATSVDVYHFEISGGVSGLTYQENANFALHSGTAVYGIGEGGLGGSFPEQGELGEGYEIRGSEQVGHSGLVAIDGSTVTGKTFDAVIISNRKFTTIKNIWIHSTGILNDPIFLSTNNGGSIIEDCIVEQGGHGINIDNSEDFIVRRNLVYGQNGANSSAIKCENSISPTSTNGLIESNLVIMGGSSTGTAGHFALQSFECTDIQFLNNTVIDTRTDGIGVLNNSANVEIKNNIIIGSTFNGAAGTGNAIGIDSTSTVGLDIDNNSYFGTDILDAKFHFGGSFAAVSGWTGGSQDTGLTAWQSTLTTASVTGADANSTEVKPDLVSFDTTGDPPTADNFKLLSSALAQIQTGVDAGVITDYDAVSFLDPPNMGAFALFIGELAAPILSTPYSNRMNISGDVVSAIDFSEGWLGAISFVITGLPNGLIATGASVAGTIVAPTGTFITNIAATNGGGTTNAQFQWTTLTTGDPTSGINVSINKVI